MKTSFRCIRVRGFRILLWMVHCAPAHCSTWWMCCYSSIKALMWWIPQWQKRSLQRIWPFLFFQVLIWAACSEDPTVSSALFVRVEPRIKPAFVSNMSKSVPPGLLMPLVLTVQIPLFPEYNFVGNKASVCWVLWRVALRIREQGPDLNTPKADAFCR